MYSFFICKFVPLDWYSPISLIAQPLTITILLCFYEFCFFKFHIPFHYISYSRGFSYFTPPQIGRVFSFYTWLNNIPQYVCVCEHCNEHENANLSSRPFGYISRIQIAGSYDSSVFIVVIIFEYISTSNNQAVHFTFI